MKFKRIWLNNFEFQTQLEVLSNHSNNIKQVRCSAPIPPTMTDAAFTRYSPIEVWVSVEETEDPKGDFVAESEFNVVRHNEAVRNIPNLTESFPFPSDFEKISAVDYEISIFRISYAVTDAEERSERAFPLGSDQGGISFSNWLRFVPIKLDKVLMLGWYG